MKSFLICIGDKLQFSNNLQMISFDLHMLLFVAVVFIALSTESYFIVTFPPIFSFLDCKSSRLHEIVVLCIGLELPNQLHVNDSGIHASNHKLWSDKN